MKKSILLLSVIIAIIGNSCTFSFSSNQKDLQKQINQLQQEVATLQKMNGLTPSYETDDDDITPPKPSDSKKTNGDEQQTVKTSKEQTAVEAIKYCLKMYVPDLKYTNIRSAPQSDGTVDVIIDYHEKYTGSVEHTYYNVTVYSNNEFKVNSCRGWSDGYFPYNSKMVIQ